MFFCDLAGADHFEQLLPTLKERLDEAGMGRVREEQQLMMRLLERFDAGNFVESVWHGRHDYQIEWNLCGETAGIVRLLRAAELHSVSLLINEHRDRSAMPGIAESMQAQLEFYFAGNSDEANAAFARSECQRLILLTRCPLVVSRYIAESFDVALASWKLLRMVSYAYFKTRGVIE